MKLKIDDVDLAIVDVLSKNAQTPYTHIAKELLISSATVHSRVKKMKALGFIKGATLVLDYKAIGWDLSIMLGVKLRESGLFRRVVSQIAEIEEVVKIHYISGKFDLFIKMHARDTEHYKEILHNKILILKDIKNVEIIISMDEHINRHINFT